MYGYETLKYMFVLIAVLNALKTIFQALKTRDVDTVYNSHVILSNM